MHHLHIGWEPGAPSNVHRLLDLHEFMNLPNYSAMEKLTQHLHNKEAMAYMQKCSDEMYQALFGIVPFKSERWDVDGILKELDERITEANKLL